MSSTIQIRVDDDLKTKSDQLFKEFYIALSEEELFQKLETARTHAQQGQVREAEAFVADVRAKYGL